MKKNLTVSGMYLSGMTIFSGTPNKLSIIRVEVGVPLTMSRPSSSLFNADLITSGGDVFPSLLPGDLRACSMSRSSRDLAPAC